MLEGVTTCVDNSDLLAETLPWTKNHFDRMVVVTAPEDVKTQRVCEYHHVECILTDSFNTRWGEFVKGAGINDGLAHLELSDWVLHFDSDIVMPPLTRALLTEPDRLDPKNIYGADRHMLIGADQWRGHIAMPRLQQEDEIWLHLDSYPLGTRIVDDTGYVPIGFFQLWNAGATGIKDYPEEHTDAGRGDMLHSKRWAPRDRVLLPNLVVYHLESEPAEKGANWGGRVTKEFGSDAAVVPNHHWPRKHHKHEHRHKHRHHYGYTT